MSTYSITNITQGSGAIDKTIRRIEKEGRIYCDDVMSFRLFLQNSLEEWAKPYPMRKKHLASICYSGDDWDKVKVEYLTEKNGAREKKTLLIIEYLP